MPFFIIFVIIPISEILVFINISDKIGLGVALLMALFTAILGGIIVKYQGIQTMMTAQKSMQSGKLPSKELFDGLCLVIAGATLITPGFISDAIGFALLIPAIRNILRIKLAKSTKFSNIHFNSEFHDTYHSGNNPNQRDNDIIDVSYETIEETTEKKD